MRNHVNLIHKIYNEDKKIPVKQITILRYYEFSKKYDAFLSQWTAKQQRYSDTAATV